MKDRTIFIAVGPQVWGRGYTKDQAKQAMRAEAGQMPKAYIIFETDDPWAFIDEMGRICYEHGCEYREVERREPKGTRRQAVA